MTRQLLCLASVVLLACGCGESEISRLSRECEHGRAIRIPVYTWYEPAGQFDREEYIAAGWKEYEPGKFRPFESRAWRRVSEFEFVQVDPVHLPKPDPKLWPIVPQRKPIAAQPEPFPIDGASGFQMPMPSDAPARTGPEPAKPILDPRHNRITDIEDRLDRIEQKLGEIERRLDGNGK